MKTVVIVNSEGMGSGDKELGMILMGAFIRKMWARDERMDSILVYNSGVKCLADGSTVLDAFSGIEEAGVDIVACGTCIDHYELNDKIKAGRRSGMEEIVDIMMSADKVITI